MRICSWCGIGISWWRFRVNGRCRKCRLDLTSAPCHYMQYLDGIGDAHAAVALTGNCAYSGAAQNCSAPAERADFGIVYDTPPSLNSGAVDVWLDR